jgi:tRNA(adenine34) deaminase
MTETKPDEYYMQMALQLAKTAGDADEVPIGAVILYENRVLARAHNQVELLNDATAHAEMLALTQASSALGDWRLENCTLFVTKEPCPMCAGAIMLSRVKRVVFGVQDPQRGGAISLFNILQNPSLNHQCEIKAHVLEEECRYVLQTFFQAKRGQSHTRLSDQLPPV